LKRIKITIDQLLLLLFDSAEIAIEKIDGSYIKILLEDYSTGDTYVLSMSILWELQYVNGFIELAQEATYPHRTQNNVILPRTQQIFNISDKGKDYIKFKYPGIEHKP